MTEEITKTDVDVASLATDIKWIRSKIEEQCRCNAELSKDMAVLKAANLPIRVGTLETNLSSHVSLDDGADQARSGISQWAMVLVAGGCSLLAGLVVWAAGKVWP